MLRRSLKRALGVLEPLGAEAHDALHNAAAATRHLQSAAHAAGAGICCSSSGRAAAAPPAARQQWRRWLSQQAGGGANGGGKQAPKSMLDSGFAGPGGSGQVLGSAAEMRMQQLQQEAAAAAAAAAAAGHGGAAAAAAAADAAPGGFARARQLVGDLLFYGSLVSASAAGYVYYTYPTKDVEQWLGDAEQRAAEGAPMWKAWAWVLDGYLNGAHYVDHKVGAAVGRLVGWQLGGWRLQAVCSSF
jgi:hypothetical protein